jgi:hypothetical protein
MADDTKFFHFEKFNTRAVIIATDSTTNLEIQTYLQKSPFIIPGQLTGSQFGGHLEVEEGAFMRAQP